MVYKDKDKVILYTIKSYRLKEIYNKVKWIILLGSNRDLKKLQLTIKFIMAQFKALIGITAIYIFVDIFNKAILSILLYNYFMGIVKSIITPYRIIIIPLKDLLL